MTLDDLKGNTKPYKAVLGFILAAGSLIWMDLQGRKDWGDLDTFEEWARIVLPALLTAGGVWLIPNPLRTRRNGAGFITGRDAVLVAIAVIVVLAIIVAFSR